MYKITKFMFITFIMVLTLGMVGCSSKKNLELDLVKCIEDVQSDSENSLYQAKAKIDTTENYLDDLGVDSSKIEDSAVSMCLDSKAYCLAIIDTKDTEAIGEQLATFADNKASQLYKEYYNESLIASQYTIKYLDNYVIFAMCEDSKNVCEVLENSLILSMSNNS